MSIDNNVYTIYLDVLVQLCQIVAWKSLWLFPNKVGMCGDNQHVAVRRVLLDGEQKIVQIIDRYFTIRHFPQQQKQTATRKKTQLQRLIFSLFMVRKGRKI